jgi:hypothetical protein
LTAEQQLERERAELAKSAAHSKRREAKVKEALDDFDRGGL